MTLRNLCPKLGTTLLLLFAAAQAQALQPGTYRCASYNVSGGGGSCRNFQPLILNADGSYRFSSTRGRWSMQGRQLILSESTLWGPGQPVGQDSIRFEYDYRGWHHVLTWTCQDCSASSAAGDSPGFATAAPSDSAARSDGAGRTDRGGQGGAAIGVTLALEFDQSVGGVSGFVIVPAESAGRYTHNAPLPEGAVQGLAWESSAQTVKLATNRNNKLVSGRRYVVFLSWPRETLPVAILDLPTANRDFTATLPARLDLRLDSLTSSAPASNAGKTTPPGPPQAPTIGVRIVDITPEIAQAVGSPGLRGAGISEVLSASAAEHAGIKAGDIITVINGKRVGSATEALDLIRNRRADAPLGLQVFRDGRYRQFQVERSQ